MRNLLLILTAVALSFLVACGDSEEATDAESGNDTATTEMNEDENAEEESSGDVSDTSFDNGDYVYEIKEVEQIVGKNDMDILAVEMTFTNNTDEATSPWMSIGLAAEQETDTTVESLTGANGRFEDDYKPELTEMGDTDVKPGATVEAVIGYEILYPGEPVRLYNRSIDDELLFEKIVKTTE